MATQQSSSADRLGQWLRRCYMRRSSAMPKPDWVPVSKRLWKRHSALIMELHAARMTGQHD